MNQIKILLLAGDTIRSCFYSQYLKKHNYNFSCLSYGSRTLNEVKIDSITEKFFKNNNYYVPNTNYDIKTFCEKSNITHENIYTEDINSFKIINYIKIKNPDLVIFSGYGGDILSRKHFDLNLPYLHMHPGDLPYEKGSTTIYYSILSKREITVTSFFMGEKIDSGKSILKLKYNAPRFGVNIDYYFDNYIRSECLIKTLNKIKKESLVNVTDLDSSDLEYFVIHPVLKHISILSLNK